DLRTVDGAALRCDQHDTVRRTRAVDRRRRRVLQNVDALDLGGVQVRDRIDALATEARREAGEIALVHRHTVDHVERLVAAGDRRRTAHPHRDGRAGRARVLHDLHTREPALQRLVHRRDRQLLDLGLRHRCRRAGHVAPTLLAISNDDQLIETQRIDLQRDHQRRHLRTDRDRLRRLAVADVVELDPVLPERDVVQETTTALIPHRADPELRDRYVHALQALLRITGPDLAGHTTALLPHSQGRQRHEGNHDCPQPSEPAHRFSLSLPENHCQNDTAGWGTVSTAAVGRWDTGSAGASDALPHAAPQRKNARWGCSVTVL